MLMLVWVWVVGCCCFVGQAHCQALGCYALAARVCLRVWGWVWCWCGGCELYSGCEYLESVVGVYGRSVDAWVPGAEEGRCGLRYASGSRRAGVDPRVSEWGNLAGVVPGRSCLNV